MKRFIYDIKAFLFLRKHIKRQVNSPEWAKYNLRRDWLYRVYTVINPSEKDKGDDDKMLEMKAVDKCAPISKYIASLGATEVNPLGLSEIVSMSMERIPETDSYLVVYYQIYQWFTPWKIFSRSLLAIVGIILLSVYWSNIFSFIKNFF
jgi:hypothetical protein